MHFQPVPFRFLVFHSFWCVSKIQDNALWRCNTASLLRFNNSQSNQIYVQRIYACRLHFKTPVTVAKSLRFERTITVWTKPSWLLLHCSPLRRGDWTDIHPLNSERTLTHRGDIQARLVKLELG